MRHVRRTFNTWNVINFDRTKWIKNSGQFIQDEGFSILPISAGKIVQGKGYKSLEEVEVNYWGEMSFRRLRASMPFGSMTCRIKITYN